MDNVSQELISQAVYRFELNLPRIEKCLDELTEDEVWQRPNSSSNSIGNLILHLCGNITQYIISGLGGKTDERNRDAEFSAEGGMNKDELRGKIRSTVINAVQVMEHLSEHELLRVKPLQGFDMSCIASVINVVEHFSYHTGQITFWTKCLKDKDMGFYSGMDLNQKNN